MGKLRLAIQFLLGYNRPDLQRDYDSHFSNIFTNSSFRYNRPDLQRDYDLFIPFIHPYQSKSYNRPDLQRDYDHNKGPPRFTG